MTSHLACGPPFTPLRMDWDGIWTCTDHLRRRALAAAVARGMRTRRTRCRVCVDVDGDGARTAGAGAVDETVAGPERQMETSAALKLEAESEKRVCGVGDQDEEMCAPFRVPVRALVGVNGWRRRTVHKGRGWQSRCAFGHVHVGVGVDGDHEAQPTLALTLLHRPSPARSPSLTLALTLLLPLERPPSPPLSGQPHCLHTPSLAMTRDDAAFTSLKVHHFTSLRPAPFPCYDSRLRRHRVCLHLGTHACIDVEGDGGGGGGVRKDGGRDRDESRDGRRKRTRASLEENLRVYGGRGGGGGVYLPRPSPSAP
ncbi:hypothetical protein B0H13DRAFT_1879662 [Mycena leptocephala]|nr:hypothetical protein B0H13DRAFT_1879662 [Mycena leptocephala]